MRKVGIYEIGDRIGIAGNSFLAKAADDESQYVVKVIRLNNRRNGAYADGVVQSAVELAPLSSAIVPIFSWERSARFVWYSTEFFPISLDRLALNGTISGEQLRGIIAAIIRNLVEIFRVSKRHHGNLKSGNVFLKSAHEIERPRIFLADAAPMRDVSVETSAVEERRALARLIYELVTRTPLSDRQRNVQLTEKWKRLGPSGQKWCDWCNGLLEVRGKLTLERLLVELENKRTRRFPYRLGAIAACVAALSVGGFVAMGYRSIPPPPVRLKPRPFEKEKWCEDQHQQLGIKSIVLQTIAQRLETSPDDERNLLENVERMVQDSTEGISAAVDIANTPDDRAKVEGQIAQIPALVQRSANSCAEQLAKPRDVSMNILWKKVLSQYEPGPDTISWLDMVVKIHSSLCGGISIAEMPGIPHDVDPQLFAQAEGWLQETYKADMAKHSLSLENKPIENLPDEIDAARSEVSKDYLSNMQEIAGLNRFYAEATKNLNQLNFDKIKLEPDDKGLAGLLRNLEAAPSQIAIRSRIAQFVSIANVESIEGLPAFDGMNDVALKYAAWLRRLEIDGECRQTVESEAQCCKGLLDNVNSSALADEKKAVVRASVFNRWWKRAELASDENQFSGVWDNAGTYAVLHPENPPADMAYRVKVNIALKSRPPKDIDDFVGKLRQIGVGDTRIDEAIASLKKWTEDKADHRKTDFKNWGPAKAGWVFNSMSHDGMVVTYSLGPTHRMRFRLLKGADCYLATTEMPVYSITQIAGGKPGERLTSFCSKHLKLRKDDVKDWVKKENDPVPVVTAPGWFDFAGPEAPILESILGVPRDDFPLQSITFEESKQLASEFGCRLPTVAEWTQAWGKETDPSAKLPGHGALNPNDMALISHHLKISYIAGLGAPTKGEPFRSVEYDDEHFHDLVGNVAEWVTGLSRERNVIGGSAFSSPDHPETAFDTNQKSMSDVGFRLAMEPPPDSNPQPPIPAFFPPSAE